MKREQEFLFSQLPVSCEMRKFSRLIRKARKLFLILIPLLMFILLQILHIQVEPLWRLKHGFQLHNTLYDRCMDLRFIPAIIEGFERLAPIVAYFINLRGIYSYYCADLVSVSLENCSKKVIDGTIALDGQEFYSTVYSPQTIEKLLNSPLNRLTVDLSVKVTKFDGGKLSSRNVQYRVSNPARLEAHKRHILANRWMAEQFISYPAGKGLTFDKTKPYLITFATECSSWLSDRLNEDYNIVILGLGTQWLGFGSRLLALKAFLQTIPRDSIVFWADAGDVAILPGCTTEAIIQSFKLFTSPILFAGEMFCWPDADKADQFPIPPHEPKFFKFLNAGSSIGYSWAYLDVLNFMDSLESISIHADDQRFWQTAYLNQVSYEKGNPKPFINKGMEAIPYIQIDFYQSVFAAFGKDVYVHDKWIPSVDAFDYTDYNTTKRLTFIPSGGKPCIFHQPGPKIKGQPEQLQKILERVRTLS